MPQHLNVLMVGDIVGAPGLTILSEQLPSLIEQYSAGFVIVNAENIYDGKGIRPADAEAVFAAGAHVITSGNHIWERWQSKDVLATRPHVLRPLNYPPGNVGYGYTLFPLQNGQKVAVINLQGRTFMQDIDCPFRAADWVLNKIGHEAAAIIVDFHAEATAEKMALGWYLDGRVSAVLGTHTHVQTNDARILTEGTAFITDVGMTGPYDSVIGMKKDVAIKRFVSQTPHKFEMAEKDAKLCGVFMKIDLDSAKAQHIESITTPSFISAQ